MLRSILSLSILATLHASAADAIDFNRDIRPILSDNCIGCHGPDEHHRKAGLRLDTKEGAIADLDGYSAIVPGNPKKSAMMTRIRETDPNEIMPPPESHKTLSKKEIDLLEKWIGEGAEYADAWTYVAPKKHAAPSTKNKNWGNNWIDSFVLANLEKKGLKPSKPADPRTLVRRLSFDLTGLPPTPAEVAEYAKNPTEAAYETLVDRYLASPAYGERMAAYWLDLVRFADTVGYHGDQDHRVGPYRDYVIEAYNQNMPFDQFTREQLAGDLLPNPTLSQKVATCYNRLLQTSHEGGVQKKEYLAIYAADRVRNVSNVWMGATVGCAQCHDHKFDPYTARDFYRMAAFFADIDEAQHFKNGGNTLPTKRYPEIPVGAPKDLKQNAKLSTSVKNLANKLKMVEGEKKQLDAKKKEIGVEANNTSLDPQLQQLASAIKKLKSELNSKKSTQLGVSKRIRHVMVTQAIKPRDIRVLPRGNWMDDSGEIVQPGIPEFMGDLATSERATRLDFANWLVADGPSGLLTARVQVNRFWYLLFGTGIAKILDDFGGQGQPPANPELLDNLAVAFVDSDWDVKAMMKRLVTSSAYRQSSVSTAEQRDMDPYNQLVAHQSRYRLPAEMIRDNALSVSKLLVDEVGGDSVKPYQPAGYYRHLNFPVRKYTQHNDDRQWRRGVYVHWQRQFLHPMMKAFDAPSREECTAERPRSNTPTAALTLLNDPTFVEAAKMLAVRLMKEAASPEDRIQLATELAWSRPARPTESNAILSLYEQDRQRYQDAPEAATALLKTGLKPVPKDLPIAEVAAWTSVARAILSTNESITRN